MAKLDEIKKKLLSETDVFIHWPEDLREFEGSYQYASELAGKMLREGGEIGFADFANGLFDGNDPTLPFNSPFPANSSNSVDLPLSVNTYPFGEKTKNVFPEFFGVCEGDQRLGRLYKAIEKQLDHYMSPWFSGPDKKSITVFTDKWDPKLFDKYEPLFLNAILAHNVYFYFYLVTDYGITRIPFMNRRQVENFKRDYGREAIEEAATLEGLIAREDITDVIYTVDRSGTWSSSPDSYGRDRYEFDFVHLRYYFKDRSGKTKRGRIKAAYALRFLRAAIALRDDGGLDDQVISLDFSINKRIDFGAFSFDWQDLPFLEKMPKAADMIGALSSMIATLR